jgi:hypothetical protein
MDLHLWVCPNTGRLHDHFQAYKHSPESEVSLFVLKITTQAKIFMTLNVFRALIHELSEEPPLKSLKHFQLVITILKH